MVWIKVDNSTIIKFETVFKIDWIYRDSVILEFYIVSNDHRFLIYNKKIYEDVEKLDEESQKKLVEQHIPEMIELAKPPHGILLPNERAAYYQPIIKNAIAMTYLNKILTILSKEENNAKIINFYKEFGTKKED